MHRIVIGLAVAAASAVQGPAESAVQPARRHVDAWESRFGIDYVFAMAGEFQKELWPRLLSQTGAGWVNFAAVGWAATEPRAPVGGRHQYKWERLDRAVRLWQKYGFRIAVSLRLHNGWFVGPIRYRPKMLRLGLRATDRLPAPQYMDDYRDWIRAMVERYDGDGRDDMPGLAYPVLHYQVGNEYANPLFWTGTIEDYGTLLKEARQAAREACPQVQIISNGIRWNDLFHDDRSGELFEQRFEAFLKRLPSDDWREGWRRARRFTEATVALAGHYDILDAGGNGPFPTASAGYMAWVRRELAKHRLSTVIWDMEARSEPRLTFNPVVGFHRELVVPGGRRVLAAMRRAAHPQHDRAVAWYRAEQARVLTYVFVTRFAAGFEKVFVGMPNDWDKSLGALSTPNPYIGLLSADGQPWPAFYALKLLVEQLDGFERAEQMPAPDGVALYRFQFAGRRPAVWVVWLAERWPRGMSEPMPRRPVELPGVGEPAEAWRIPTAGQQPERIALPARQPVTIELDPTPVIVRQREQ